ncbi:hypothetical protein [Ekhidna sp.]|uniref:hypothetical protein n=1 Tax=Ekhidna sp. TaxID=2608089 RepID=UPI003CCBD4BC
MFENLNFSSSLDENEFEEWLESGRSSKIRYSYLVILWDEIDRSFHPVYLSEREELKKYTDDYSNVGDTFVAAYDLFTESKIM